MFETNFQKEFLEKIRFYLGKTAFETWFSPIKIKTTNKNELILEVPDNFFKDWIEAHYLETIHKALEEITPSRPLLLLEVNPDLLQKKAQTAFKKIRATFKEKPSGFLKLNPRFTFENFVVGASNHLAYAASRAVAEAPGKIYNPFFIYGKVGLGKTHLMQAIAHYISKRNNFKIKYLSSECFTNELIGAIQNRTTQKFREKYREVDILLIDDVHFIAGKESTQEEFFHTFNVLYDNHHQIVLSSDRPPKQISNLEERLVSRFSWGLVVDIQPPDLETRVAILKKKLENEIVKIDDGILRFIAENITTNIRELEGALIRVMAYALIENKNITLDLVKTVLSDLVRENRKKIDSEIIIEKVANYFKISKEALKSKKRSKNVVLPKQVTMYLLRELTDYSLGELGNILGAKHHTTILYAHKKIKEALKQNKDLKDKIENILQAIHS